MALYSVTFSELFVHQFDDYDTYQTMEPNTFQLQASRGEQIIAMVNGRRVSITTEGVSRSWTVTLPFAARSLTEWIKENQGIPVLVRSPFGDLFYATINSLSRDEMLLPGIVHDTPVGTTSFILSEIDE